jgi:hypothetical protein
MVRSKTLPGERVLQRQAAPTMPIYEVWKELFVNRHFPAIQRVDFQFVHVGADNIVPQLGKNKLHLPGPRNPIR